jgi:hypothetical protein
MCGRSNADRRDRSKEMISNYLREQLDNGIYLCELCIHERLSKAEKDEVGVRHETVSSDCRRVNLNKKSDRATNRAYYGMANPQTCSLQIERNNTGKVCQHRLATLGRCPYN